MAYREFDAAGRAWKPYTWSETARMAGRVRAGLAAEGLVPGERVAIMLRNGMEWVWFDQGALAQGLVTVPVYVDDRPDNIAYCLNDSGVKLLVVEGEDHLKRLAEVRARMPGVTRIVADQGRRGGRRPPACGRWPTGFRRGRRRAAGSPSTAARSPPSSTPRAPRDARRA